MPKLAQAVHRTPFVLAFTLFTLLLCALEYIFCLFTSRTAAALLPLLPTALLLALLRWTGSPTFLPPAITAAAAVRLFTSLVPHRDRIHLWGTFLLDAVAAYLYLARQALTGEFPTDKILFIILAVLTLSALQQLLTGQNRAPYPFFYYALLGCILIFLPMSPKPLDWSPVVEAGQRLAHAVVNVVDEATYFLSSAFDDGTYTAGYSSLDVNGGAVDSSDRTQLILTMAEKPYFTYTDPETEQKMRVRRTLYLAGGRGANKQQLVSFLNFLHANGADRAYARLFSKTSEVGVEYALIDTFDEIAPSGAFRLYTGKSTVIESGRSTSKHRKGYKLNARYLDIDYGSPYLTGLLRNFGNASNSIKTALTYEEACDYARTLYGIELNDILTSEEYAELTTTPEVTDTPEVTYTPEVTDTTGSSDRDEATSGVSEPGLVARILRIALPVALSVLLLLAILIAGTGALSRLRYNHASPNKKLQMDVEMVKKAIRRQASEDFTDRGLLTDYLDQAPEALRLDIKKVFDIYYRVLYGNSNATAQENEFARQVREQLTA